MDYSKIKKAHFIGIGGIGISAVARMMLLEGKEVSGSDRETSTLTEELKKQGATIFEGHARENIPDDVDVVIYTIAIPEDNPELTRAKEKGIPFYTYPQILGLISENKFTIAVSGTHGKTTTTGMLAKILIDAKLHPTVILGSILKEGNSNFIVGKPTEGQNDIFLVEACEYKRSFLNLTPDILIITNIDEDHLDYYKDLEDIKNAFKELTGRVKEGGVIVTDVKNEIIARVLSSVEKKVVDYGSCDMEGTLLAFPGAHNRKNACAALTSASLVGVERSDARASLSHFKGTWRRFEYKGETSKGAKVYDDYAHHPTEVRESIRAFKEVFPEKKISVLFQPHLYSRTKLLFDDFVSALSLADGVALAPIYAAREKKDDTIRGEMLVAEINKGGEKAIFMETFDEMISKIYEWADADDVVVTMGAGDIYKVGEALLRK